MSNGDARRARGGQGALERALRRLRRANRGIEPPGGRVDLAPASTFEALLEERIRALERGAEELKGRVNGLIFLVVGAVVVQVVLGLLR